MGNNFLMLKLLKLAAAKSSRKWEGKTPNYAVESLKDIPESEQDSYTWRRKVVYDKQGHRHVINLACRGGKCQATSIWHPKSEPMAQKARKNLKQL